MKLYVEEREQQKVWDVREAGLGATAFVPGEPLTWEGWEDSAVAPDQVGDYLRDLRKLYDKYQYNSAMYGPRPGMYPLPGEFRSHERSRHSQMAGIHGRGDRPGRQPWRIDFGRTWRRPVQS